MVSLSAWLACSPRLGAAGSGGGGGGAATGPEGAGTRGRAGGGGGGFLGPSLMRVAEHSGSRQEWRGLLQLRYKRFGMKKTSRTASLILCALLSIGADGCGKDRDASHTPPGARSPSSAAGS